MVNLAKRVSPAVQAALDEAESRTNGLEDVAADLAGLSQMSMGGPFGAGGAYPGQTISQPWTLFDSNSFGLLSLYRNLLAQSFVTQGLVQTVVQQPVEDAFADMFQIKTTELDDEELEKLMQRIMKENEPSGDTSIDQLEQQSGVDQETSDLAAVMEARGWARLFGGAGLIVDTDQNPMKPLRIDAIGEDTPLEFIAADRWELILSATNINDPRYPVPFNYYGQPLHKSRVIKTLGVKAPSIIRLRLQGWGMSEIERCIRPINAFLKQETVYFELLDEAKIDIYKIAGYNEMLGSAQGEDLVKRRIFLANYLKNYQRGIAMDAEDDYDHKTLESVISGVAAAWNEIRLNLSSALKIPMNKLFGQSASGFSSGEDAIENYNALVKTERYKAEPMLRRVINLRCQQLFGFVPEYTFEWPALKVLDGVEEDQVLTGKQNRAIQLFQTQLTTAEETSQILKKDGLLAIDTEVLRGERDVDPMEAQQLEQQGDQFDKGLQSQEKIAAKKDKAKPAKKT